MTKDNFAPCLDHAFEVEGGFVNHPKDPGGATNMGITKATLEHELGRSVTVDEVRNLSRSVAARIYRRKYWGVIRGDDLPAGFDLVAFDGAINSGPRRGARWLQVGLGGNVARDGKIGPQTLSAAQGRADGVQVIERACAARMGFLQRLKHWQTFRRGWTARVAKVEATAVAMWAGSRAAVKAQESRATVAQRRDQKTAQATGAGTVGGAGGVELTGIPDAVALAVLVVGAVAIGWALMRARQNKTRAAAFEAVAGGMTDAE
ncbi:glycoside hydrolase family 108 protein [Sagittula sp. NFXS13]|uniref:glycoside hydrolase family 108 protein n=1 Tax=Sagittula sp. NFXS13 TaxID=2819095 RepID=UPI0032DE992A